MTGDEIRAQLSRFAADWSLFNGGERQEAQTFLNCLFECYGKERRAVAEFEAPQEGRFLDLIWPGVCIFEMKAPSESKRLSKHREQAIGYWKNAADPGRNLPAPPYVVLCSFHKFEVWEPGKFPKQPLVTFDLVELPERYDALLFLVGDEPVFRGGQAAVTREAAQKLSELNLQLADRRAGGPEERRGFILQCVWCMFAEDLGQIPGHRFTRVVEGLIADRNRSSADDLGRLFEYLNDPATKRPERGLYSGTPYANGELFKDPGRLDLTVEELELLREASEFSWHEVQPQIFGSLLEGTLGHDKQWELGAHYTHESEIQKIVQPTVVAPWVDRVENLSSHAEALAAQTDLLNYVVLDPACGSGNFLYIAYRELRRIEQRLREREAELRRARGHAGQQALSAFFPLQNIRGIEVDRFAVELARVTLWMGHKLAVDELQLSEPTLPLTSLPGIQFGDALRMRWPRADAIISNPPYHGSQQLRAILGDDYVDGLAETFGCGVKDHCVYWFRKAADHLQPDGRAGMVGTNSISQNRARVASLNYVVEKGGVITNAVSRQKWPGEAVVNVSIVNWVQNPSEPPRRFVLDGDEVVGISTRLRESKLAVEEFEPLPENAGRAFQGPIPVGDFYLDSDEAKEIVALKDAKYSDVIKPYLVGEDIADDPTQRPTRYVIDFGLMSLEQAMRFPAALQIVRERVKPKRDRNPMQLRRENWWQFGSSARTMRNALESLSRYIAGNAQGKRFLFCWCDAGTCPSNLTNVFAFDDDYAMGVLTASPHQAWARAEASSLEDRPRYTPTTCFETFPWPAANAGARRQIGDLGQEIIERRQGICRRENIGLTTLYNQVDEGAWAELAGLHRKLDEAVAAVYGWPKKVARDPLELRVRLAKLNRDIAAGKTAYQPFGYLTESG